VPGDRFTTKEYVGSGLARFTEFMEEIYDFVKKKPSAQFFILINEGEFFQSHVRQNKPGFYKSSDLDVTKYFLNLSDNINCVSHDLKKHTGNIYMIFTTNFEDFDDIESIIRRLIHILSIAYPTKENISKVLMTCSRSFQAEEESKRLLSQVVKDNLEELTNRIYKKHQERFMEKAQKIIQQETKNPFLQKTDPEVLILENKIEDQDKIDYEDKTIKDFARKHDLNLKISYLLKIIELAYKKYYYGDDPKNPIPTMKNINDFQKTFQKRGISVGGKKKTKGEFLEIIHQYIDIVFDGP